MPFTRWMVGWFTPNLSTRVRRMLKERSMASSTSLSMAPITFSLGELMSMPRLLLVVLAKMVASGLLGASFW